MNAAPTLAGALSTKASNKHGDSQLARILADMCRPGVEQLCHSHMLLLIAIRLHDHVAVPA